MSIANEYVQSTNNNQYPCHFKLIVNASNNSIYYSAENNSFFQDFVLNNQTLTRLKIVIRDRYNNLIINYFNILLP